MSLYHIDFTSAQLTIVYNFGYSSTVSCFIFQKGSTDDLGEVLYYPDNTFNMRYYPYYGKLRHVGDKASNSYSKPIHFSVIVLMACYFSNR